jgi:hypothetical protein
MLPLLPFLLRMVIHIGDRANNVRARIEKHLPAVLRPRRRRAAILPREVGERMKAICRQLPRRRCLQVADDLFDFALVPGDHHMYMLGQNAAGENLIIAIARGCGKSEANAARLHAIEDNRRILQRIFRGEAQLSIMRSTRNRACRAGLNWLEPRGSLGSQNPYALKMTWEARTTAQSVLHSARERAG